jgi:mRNA-degrading endonuclease YafQ of YafQ-DinJ toxin-antitoxin module
MREIKYTTRFQRDYKREKSGKYRRKIDALLMETVSLPAVDASLPRRSFDHPLIGRMERPSGLPHQARPRTSLPEAE